METEKMYSFWTHFWFHAFVALLVLGFALMVIGNYLDLPLLTASGPFALSAAFSSLWYCSHRASRERPDP